MEKKVVVYTKDGCIFCDKQKRWLAAHSISYKEKNVENNEYRQELAGKKVTGVPYTILILNGKEEVNIQGFDVKKLEQFLLGE
ncbi:glutaredoxin family protein [Bacillus velezensis]|uniref:glutaredoxin family protein n=1 Tax=Bacillus amyloliquefaciens group TaxID=1938374 RepID=UPI0013D66F31|nr:glutaredoxin family protein [Bacillus velezensis]MEC2277229.1 glutaredoxin family protein [Bacillus velezensis]MEC2312058.1 glutaredoxin family protein [Bacillus velezensis]MED3700900.1 glutaredoxin family protein [Bacillus velezensis]